MSYGYHLPYNDSLTFSKHFGVDLYKSLTAKMWHYSTVEDLEKGAEELYTPPCHLREYEKTLRINITKLEHIQVSYNNLYSLRGCTHHIPYFKFILIFVF